MSQIWQFYLAVLSYSFINSFCGTSKAAHLVWMLLIKHTWSCSEYSGLCLSQRAHLPSRNMLHVTQSVQWWGKCGCRERSVEQWWRAQQRLDLSVGGVLASSLFFYYMSTPSKKKLIKIHEKWRRHWETYKLLKSKASSSGSKELPMPEQLQTCLEVHCRHVEPSALN